MTASRLRVSLVAAAFGAGLLAMAPGSGYAEEKSEAEKKYDEQVDKCQQMSSHDEQQECLDQAMQEYQEEKAKHQ